MKKLKMYINGKWEDSSSGEFRDIISPANGEIIAEAAEGDCSDAKKAIVIARETFDSGIWSDLPAVDRAVFLYAIADKLEERAEEISYLETLDNGKPLRETQLDVADAVACFRYYAGMVTKPDGVTYQVSDPMQAMVVREPVGVCGLIVPWNYPLLMSVWKIAPALAAGNTIVFKPSEVTPVTAQCLFEIIEEVGIPAGV
ncbi:aldehyde dehydrogenase family protein, partial [Butyricicoccus sp. 1XD8-22]